MKIANAIVKDSYVFYKIKNYAIVFNRYKKLGLKTSFFRSFWICTCLVLRTWRHFRLNKKINSKKKINNLVNFFISAVAPFWRIFWTVGPRNPHTPGRCEVPRNGMPEQTFVRVLYWLDRSNNPANLFIHLRYMVTIPTKRLSSRSTKIG